MDAYLNEFRDLLNPERLVLFVATLGRALIILLVAYIGSKFADRFIRLSRANIVAAMARRSPGTSVTELEKRAQTIGRILRRTIGIAIWVVALVMILNEFNFNIGPVLASAGIVGLAVGFGAQNLVRDAITGLLMLVENQIRVNDVAIINGTGGLVEEINLRTTVLRGLDGTVHVFQNGAITSLSNMTYEFSFYVFDIGVAYKEDTDRVSEVLRDVAEDLRKDQKYGPMILEPLEVLGVDQFADSAVVIKARLKTIPIQQWAVGREMNRRIKKRFDEEGIEIPFPHRSIYFGEASKPFALRFDGASREELKAVVREVLAEGAGKGLPSSEDAR